MEILQSIRRHFALIGFLPDERVFRYESCHTLLSLFIFSLFIEQVLASLIFLIRHLQMGDIERGLYAGFQVSLGIAVIGSFVTIMYNKDKVREVIVSFLNIFDECKKDSFDLFIKAVPLNDNFCY